MSHENESEEDSQDNIMPNFSGLDDRDSSYTMVSDLGRVPGRAALMNLTGEDTQNITDSNQNITDSNCMNPHANDSGIYDLLDMFQNFSNHTMPPGFEDEDSVVINLERYVTGLERNERQLYKLARSKSIIRQEGKIIFRGPQIDMPVLEDGDYSITISELQDYPDLEIFSDENLERISDPDYLENFQKEAEEVDYNNALWHETVIASGMVGMAASGAAAYMRRRKQKQNDTNMTSNLSDIDDNASNIGDALILSNGTEFIRAPVGELSDKDSLRSEEE